MPRIVTDGQGEEQTSIHPIVYMFCMSALYMGGLKPESLDVKRWFPLNTHTHTEIHELHERTDLALEVIHS